MMQTHVLLGHCLDIAHLITEELTVMNDLRFENKCKDCMSDLDYFIFIKTFCDRNRF